MYVQAVANLTMNIASLADHTCDMLHDPVSLTSLSYFLDVALLHSRLQHRHARCLFVEHTQCSKATANAAAMLL